MLKVKVVVYVRKRVHNIYGEYKNKQDKKG